MAVAYGDRPAYPAEVFDVLAGLVVEPQVALDGGCGTGGLFRPGGAVQTSAMVVEQAIGENVESIHSRNGFSRDRMVPEAQRAFDGAPRDVLAQHASDGTIRFAVSASIVWGRPSPP